MFQRRPTIPSGAASTLGRLKSSDTATHDLNALGAKSFRSLAYNPSGPQRRVVVTKNVATVSRVEPWRATGGRAPVRSFSK